jgi:diguanylate cyclase with GGDEF domain
MSELPDDTPPARRRASRGGRRQRFVLPADQHDERVGEVIEAFLEGPPPKARRRVRQATRPARLRPTRLRPVPLDTRADWDIALRHEDARMARYGRPASVVVIRLRLTPPASADRIAARVAEIVRSQARETDRVTRAAADRFHVLLPETEEADAETLIERVRAACASQVAGRLGAELRVVAAAVSPAQGETLHDALRTAQVAVGATSDRL